MVERDSPLREIAPTFMGTLAQTPGQNAGGSEKERAEAAKPCVVLNDMLAEYEEPSILDIKLGSVLWEKTATPDKVARLQKVVNETTSGSLGFRITAMSVVQPDGVRKDYDKNYGRKCSAEEVVEYIRPFFPNLDTDPYMRAVVDALGTKVEAIKSIIEKEPVEMHACSILLVYEGKHDALVRKIEENMNADESAQASTGSDSDSDEEPSKSGIVSTSLIDFGHAYFVDEPSEDIVRGVTNFLKEFKKLQA